MIRGGNADHEEKIGWLFSENNGILGTGPIAFLIGANVSSWKEPSPWDAQPRGPLSLIFDGVLAFP
jgi:hypothetical protein